MLVQIRKHWSFRAHFEHLELPISFGAQDLIAFRKHCNSTHREMDFKCWFRFKIGLKFKNCLKFEFYHKFDIKVQISFCITTPYKFSHQFKDQIQIFDWLLVFADGLTVFILVSLDGIFCGMVFILLIFTWDSCSWFPEHLMTS